MQVMTKHLVVFDNNVNRK